MAPTGQITPDQANRLHAAGGHLVVCGLPTDSYDDRKQPARKRWQAAAPPLPDVLAAVSAHRMMGVIPASLDLVAIDLDAGNPETVIGKVGRALVRVRSGKGGEHLIYRSPECDDKGKVRNRKWSIPPEGRTCYGDIRGSEGFVVLWDADAVLAAVGMLDGAERLDLLPRRRAAQGRGPDAVRNAPRGRATTR